MVKEEEQKKIEKHRPIYLGALDTIARLDQSTKGKEILADVKALSAKNKEADGRVMLLSTAGKSNEAVALLMKEGKPLSKNGVELFANLVRYHGESSRNAFQEALASYTWTRNANIVHASR